MIDPGSDLAQQGMTEYMFDILYLTWGIQLLVAFTTTWAWWLYLLVCCPPSVPGAKDGVADEVDSRVCGDEGLGIAEGTRRRGGSGAGDASKADSITETSGGETVMCIHHLRTYLYPTIPNVS